MVYSTIKFERKNYEKEYCKNHNLLHFWETSFCKTIKYLIINHAYDFVKNTLDPDNYEVYISQLEKIVIKTIKDASRYHGLMQKKSMRLFIRIVTVIKKIRTILKI